MRSENDTELWERYLWIEGRLSAKVQKRGRAFRRGLPAQISRNSRIVFVRYAYADLELPKDFSMMFQVNQDECVHSYERYDCTHFRPHHLASVIDAPSRIIAVTQQMDIPFPNVPDGWKTVCVVEFSKGVPAMIDNLPEVFGWGISRQGVCLCDYQTWSALVDMEPC
ncbi:hypothetical protein [Microseira wollei]|uniref:ASCH domain-containing protein n=1 Tax=Microseira wollei NIES-4236 TaxID=2530354 RepID=A0AAV3XJK1_9CYAN|nr:hypothetical protein [Microseira wollei]GET40709.1 hypothetical protein MiSe_55200 [Microseira wollei NIES-4236]